MVVPLVNTIMGLSSDSEPIYEGRILVDAKVVARCESYYYLTYRGHSMDIRMPLSFATRELVPHQLITVEVDFMVTNIIMHHQRCYVKMCGDPAN